MTWDPIYSNKSSGPDKQTVKGSESHPWTDQTYEIRAHEPNKKHTSFVPIFVHYLKVCGIDDPVIFSSRVRRASRWRKRHRSLNQEPSDARVSGLADGASVPELDLITKGDKKVTQ